ncbi:MAG: hypothetical protein R3E97_23020 [Candidatus Eisenbacteria bacterium]
MNSVKTGRWLGSVALSLLVLVLVASAAQSQGVDLSSLPSHPRLLLTPEVQTQMRAEALSGPKVSMFAEIKRRADSYLDDPPSVGMYKMVCLIVTGVIQNDSAYFERAASDYVYTLTTRGWAPEVIEYSLVYDWLYDYMTPSERELARTLALDAYVPGGQRTVYYNLEANEATFKGLAGIAFYGDGSSQEDAFCQTLVDEWDGRMRGVREFAFPGGSAASRGGVLPTRNYYFPDGGYYKGNHYVQKDTEGIVTYLMVFDQCGIADHWDLVRDYIEDWAEYMLWARRPDNWSSRMMSGLLYGWEKRGWYGLGAIGSYLPNGWAQWWLHSQTWGIGENGSYDWGLPAIVWRPQTPPNINELPMHKFYGGNGETNVPGTSWSEKVFTRTGWNLDTDNDDVYFTFQAGDFFGDYWNFYQLGFEIYYRGALAIRSGYYESGGGHDFGYYGRAVSNNCVVVLDRSQGELGDIWGQDWLYEEPGRPEDIYDVADNNVYDFADVVAFEHGTTESGRPFDYMKGILKPNAAYYYTNGTRKVSKQEREIVADGHYFVVRDRVELSGGTNSVRWLLHTIDEPELDSPQLLSTTVAGHIETYGLTSYSATRTEVVQGNDYDGKITVVPLVPADAVLRKVGGAGYECWVDDGDGNGQNFPVDDPERLTGKDEAGQWRVETIAPTGLETDFVHAIWVGRPNQTMAPVRAIEDESSIGCEIDGVGVYVFARTPASQDGLDYEIQGSLEIPNVIEGLVPHAEYLVQVGGEQRALFSSEVGGITFDASGPAAVRVSQVPMASR